MHLLKKTYLSQPYQVRDLFSKKSKRGYKSNIIFIDRIMNIYYFIFHHSFGTRLTFSTVFIQDEEILWHVCCGGKNFMFFIKNIKVVLLTTLLSFLSTERREALIIGPVSFLQFLIHTGLFLNPDTYRRRSRSTVQQYGRVKGSDVFIT